MLNKENVMKENVIKENVMKEEIANNVLLRLKNFPVAMREQVYEAVIAELANAHFSPDSDKDDTASSLETLNKFVTTKRIEGMSEQTLQRYYYEVKQLIEYCQKPLSNITSDDVRDYLSYRKTSTKLKPLSNRTLDGMRRVFCSFFNWLVAEKLLTYNPMSTIKSIKYKKKVRKPFSTLEIQLLKEACKDNREVALIDWLLSTGCRVSEVVNTDIDDVDFETMECIVTGKGDKERRVYLTPICAMHLKRYLEERKDISPALFNGKGTDRLSKAGIERVVKEIGKRAGVADVHPHRFRRTLGSELYAKGMPLLDIAQILGHEDIGTTQIYCYADPVNVKNGYNSKMCA